MVAKQGKKDVLGEEGDFLNKNKLLFYEIRERR